MGSAPNLGKTKSVEQPSADLLRFRFDQIDAQFAEVKQTLNEMRDSAISKAEIMLMRSDTLKELADIRTVNKKQDLALLDLQKRSDQLEGSLSTLKWLAIFLATIAGAFVTLLVARHG